MKLMNDRRAEKEEAKIKRLIKLIFVKKQLWPTNGI